MSLVCVSKDRKWLVLRCLGVFFNQSNTDASQDGSVHSKCLFWFLICNVWAVFYQVKCTYIVLPVIKVIFSLCDNLMFLFFLSWSNLISKHYFFYFKFFKISYWWLKWEWLFSAFLNIGLTKCDWIAEAGFRNISNVFRNLRKKMRQKSSEDLA